MNRLSLNAEAKTTEAQTARREGCGLQASGVPQLPQNSWERTVNKEVSVRAPRHGQKPQWLEGYLRNCYTDLGTRKTDVEGGYSE